jgi:membrane protease YdiL (CAAX protease family)
MERSASSQPPPPSPWTRAPLQPPPPEGPEPPADEVPSAPAGQEPEHEVPPAPAGQEPEHEVPPAPAGRQPEHEAPPPVPAQREPEATSPAPPPPDPATTVAWTWSTSLLGLLVAAAAIVIGLGTLLAIASTATGHDATDAPAGIQIGATFLQDGLLIAIAALVARTTGPLAPWKLGLRPPTEPRRAVGWVIVAYLGFIAFSAIWVQILDIHQTDDLPDQLGVKTSDAALIAVAVLTCVVAPVAEELFFRGFFFVGLRRSWGTPGAAIATGVVFGAIHAGSAPAGYLVPLGVLGVVLCLLYVATKSLLPSIGLHCLNNAIAYGTSVDWDWQIPLLFLGSAATIALGLYLVRRRFGPAPPTLAAV